ncbi:MAG: hypothetical protein ACYDD1_14920 [Caulobacteraceae bacterium]
MAKSSTKITYIVQPYWRSGKGLQPGTGKRHENEEKALQDGRMMESRNAGVVVMAVEYDADCDFFGEPRLIATYGEVPEA